MTVKLPLSVQCLLRAEYWIAENFVIADTETLDACELRWKLWPAYDNVLEEGVAVNEANCYLYLFEHEYQKDLEAARFNQETVK